MPKSYERLPKQAWIDAVKYADELGDKNASAQYGVSPSVIKYWRRKVSKISAEPPFKLMKSPTERTKGQRATSGKSNSVAMNGDDKILADWLLERMDEDHFPSLSEIGKKAQELDLKHSLWSKAGAAAMMRRSGLKQRWCVGAHQRLSLQNRKVHNFNFFTSNKAKSQSTGTKVKKQHTKRKRITAVTNARDREKLEKLLIKWVTERMDCGCRPTAAEVAREYMGLAKTNNIKFKELKSMKSFGYNFLGKTGLRDRWKNMLHNTDSQQKFVRNQSKIGYTNPIMEEEILKDKTNKLASISGIKTCHKYPAISKNAPFQCSIKKNGATNLIGKTGATKNRLMMVTCDAIEQQLVDWLKVDFTNDSHPVKEEVIAKVHEIMRELNITDFKPTDSWYCNFMREKYGPIATDATVSSTSSENAWNDCIPVSSIEMEQTENAVGTQDMFTWENAVSEDSTDSDEDIEETFSNDSDDSVTLIDSSIKTEPDMPTVNVFSPSRIVKPMDTANNICGGTSIHCCNKENSGKQHDGGLVVKRKFGSFHSSNLKEQLRYAESASYVPMEIPVRPPMFEEYTVSDCKFGSAVRKKHFFLEQGCVFLNHGAFGGALKEAVDYSYDWQRYLESQPLRFFDRVLFPQVVHVQKRLAKFIGCKTSEITFTTNVTTAINAVLQGLPLNEESSIYYLSLTYGAVKKIIKHVCMRTGAKAIEVTVTLPLSKPDDIVSLVRSTLKSTTTLAIFDHIPSNYAFIMPIRELVTVCHQRGVQVLIDGAHGLGQLHLDLSILGADYYMGNCHKWFCSPKGCAFMYVNKQLQRLTRGLIISHGYDDGFHSQFAWTGAKDYCSYLSLHALINFWTTVGPNKIRQYCKSLLEDAVKYFKSKWDVELLAPIEYHGMMCCVSLPSVLYSGKDVSYNDAEAIQNRLYSEFNIEVPIKCIDNMLYVRISAHIYNEFSEYATLASAILQIANTVTDMPSTDCVVTT